MAETRRTPARAISVAIVDDERLARERLRRLLEAEPDLRVIGTAATGSDAVRLVLDETPDLLFLDLQMPELDGFGVARRLLSEMRADELPVIVFVTAFDEHALRAFDAGALDYLVKPFADERFAETLRRARRSIAQARVRETAERLRELLDDATPGTREATRAPADAAHGGESAVAEGSGALERVLLKSGGRSRLVRADRIDWIEAEGVYARLHVGPDSFLIRIPMHELETRLDARRFVRIHRSTIVNLDRVRELREPDPGAHVAVLEDGTALRISRTRKTQLEKRLGQAL
ncbi:MAG TPA: LytTR family DNA-binding domain-containing protein [Longimicrobiales bacterium]